MIYRFALVCAGILSQQSAQIALKSQSVTTCIFFKQLYCTRLLTSLIFFYTGFLASVRSVTQHTSLTSLTFSIPYSYTSILIWWLVTIQSWVRIPRQFIKVLVQLIILHTAASFYDKYAGSVGHSHKSEMKELAEITSVRHLSSSTLATKFRCRKHSYLFMITHLPLCP